MTALQPKQLPHGVAFCVTLAGQVDPVCVIVCDFKSGEFFQYANTWAKAAAHYIENSGNSASVLQANVELDERSEAKDRLQLDQQIKGVDLESAIMQVAKVDDKIVGIGLGPNKECVKRGAYLAAACGIHVKEDLLFCLQKDHLRLRKELKDMPVVSGKLQALVGSSRQERSPKSRSPVVSEKLQPLVGSSRQGRSPKSRSRSARRRKDYLPATLKSPQKRNWKVFGCKHAYDELTRHHDYLMTKFAETGGERVAIDITQGTFPWHEMIESLDAVIQKNVSGTGVQKVEVALDKNHKIYASPRPFFEFYDKDNECCKLLIHPDPNDDSVFHCKTERVKECNSDEKRVPPLAAAERVLSELYGKHSSAINRDGFGPRESQEKAIQRFLWKHGFTWVQLHLRIHAETQEWSFANTTVPDLFSSFLKEGLQ